MFSPVIYLMLHSLFFTLRLSGGGGSFPRPLKPEEEKRYLERCAAGDLEARNVLVEHNLRLVAHIVKKYYAQTGDQDDLISIGTIGLIKGISTFKADKNVRLATYASRCIENEIRMQFRRNRKTGGTVSLQEALESDGDSALTLADVLQDSFCMEDTCETQDDIRRMRQLLDGLPARERQIILLRYGLSGQPPLTQLETAKLLDISRSYVSRLETHALELLRQRWDVPSTKTAQR
ncbi:sigma-70 family RNA polymerase sigma factor [Faecalibacterium sp.]|uniref:sigma-70 family RNA polymerase sigma factor n=1 Tax=Faecalibacterium sp. TaxID=1971605 RepID=UPI003A9577E5